MDTIQYQYQCNDNCVFSLTYKGIKLAKQTPLRLVGISILNHRMAAEGCSGHPFTDPPTPLKSWRC